MKIYHEEFDGPAEIEEQMDLISSSVSKDMKSLLLPFFKMSKYLYREKISAFWEMNKYKLMWTLRHLENEIEEEGGIFILKNTGEIEMREFSLLLKEKMMNAIEESKR